MTMCDALQVCRRRDSSEAGRERLQPMSSVCQQKLYAASETLLEFVEALRVLSQALPRVRECESTSHRGEIVTVVTQLSAYRL